MVAYGKIQGDIVAQFISQKYKNVNYEETPTRGGTIKVKRMKSAVDQDYGTARSNGAGNKLQNNGVDVKIDTDKEFAEEMSAKDMVLYAKEGGIAILNSRKQSMVLRMGVTLENAYFLKLQTEATTFDSSSFTASDPLEAKVAKLEALIRKLESVKNENVQNVDRSQMLITLAPEHYDDLEKYCQKLPNPLNGGVEARFFRRVLVESAVRQTVDAVIQVVGSMTQPVVMGEFYVKQADFSADHYAYMPYFFGTKAVMTDLIFKTALSSDNNISI